MSGATNREHREAEEVDRLIKRLSPTQQHRVTGPYSGPLPTLDIAGRAAAAPAATRSTVSLRSAPLSRRPFGIRAFVGLSFMLGVAMPYWPYGHACGWGLAFYSLAIMTVMAAGVWTSVLTWYSRLGVSHVVAVLVFAWGVTLSAAEVLPRTGVIETAATWWCRTN